jgi:hypothetical protein
MFMWGLWQVSMALNPTIYFARTDPHALVLRVKFHAKRY